MTTSFDLLRRACGLSQQEAADFIGAHVSKIKKWCAGRATPSDPAIYDTLADLEAAIETAAAQAIVAVESELKGRAAPENIEIGYCVDAVEVRTLGFPCVGAHDAMLGRVIARLTARGLTVKVGPRGATPGTAAAADARERGGEV